MRKCLPKTALLMLICSASVAGAEMLPGSEWEPIALNGEAFEPQAEIFIRLEKDAIYVGNGGCNSFRGAFVTNGDAILFSPAAVTRMACPEPIARQEDDFLAAVGSARFFERDGTQLVLSSDNRTEVLELRQRDAD